MSASESVNLLALDGGGIRGVSELVILDEVMRMVQQRGKLANLPKPCDCFHLMGGTSTGGLVAIMLGRLEMSTQDALDAYDKFASDIFSKGQWSAVEMFQAKVLEETIKNLVDEQKKGTFMRSNPGREKGHAFVCTIPAQRHKEMVCLRTYDVEGDKHSNFLIYEAARATTAATRYFKPMTITDEGKEEEFIDAAFGTNNPISVLWDEAVNLFGKKRRLGCVVSIGTGSCNVEMVPQGKWAWEQAKFLLSALDVVQELVTDSEKDHQRWQAKFVEFENTYFRLNVDGGSEGIGLSDWQKIGQLKERTREYLQTPSVKKMIDDLAEVLLENRSSGLNLAHGGNLSKETTLPADPKAIRRGKSSNIFTGRETILNRLDKYFGPRKPGDTSRREFHPRGMGGVGKTQVALKFTERNEHRFNTFWVDATDVVTTEESYKQIASAIFNGQEAKDPVQEVLLWLHKSQEQWLLVLDNVPASRISKYLPDGDRGNILYTSRQHQLQPRLRPDCVANIDTMDAPEGILLLLRSAQKATDAGAYIHMAPCPLNEYLAVFNKQKEALLRSPRFKGGDGQRHIAVYATFDVSYRAIKAFADRKEDVARVDDASNALSLLNLISFYHNEGVIGVLFERAALNRHKAGRSTTFPLKAGEVDLESLVEIVETELAPEHPDGIGWQCNDFFGGLGFLNEFSLIKCDVSLDYYNMHILVHEWARNRMDGDDKAHWGLAAKGLIMDSIGREKNVRGARFRRDILPHMEACLKHVDAEHENCARESEYLSKAAAVFEQATNLDAAVMVMLKALEYRKKYHGLLHDAPAAAMYRLAQLYRDQAQYDKAEEMILEAIDRRTLYLKEQNWQALQEAEMTSADGGMGQKAVLDAFNPLDDRCIRKYKSLLGTVLTRKDNISAGADLFEEFARWHESKDGKDCALARSWRDKIRTFQITDFSQPDTRQSMSIEEASEEHQSRVAELGHDHHLTISAKKSLAKALMRQDACAEAQKLFWQVCRWSKSLYGENSLEHMDAMFALGGVYLDQNRLYDAGDFYLITMCRYEDLLGSYHTKTIDSMLHLALVSAAKAEYEEAIKLITSCLDRYRTTLGFEHRKTLLSSHLLSQYQYCQRTYPDYVKASITNRAIQVNKDASGEFAPQWMREWEAPDETAMLKERLDRGETIYGYELKEVSIDGFPFYQLNRIKEYTGQEAVANVLQWH